MSYFILIWYFVLTVFWYASAIEFRSHDAVNGTRKVVTTDGSILFGGLFPIHSKAKGGASGTFCGKLNHERGIHRMEAMLFAVDMVNRNRTLLPKQTVGMNVRDTCGVDTHALEESIEFIKGNSDNIGSNAGCESSAAERVIAGVIGAASSGISIQVANLLRLFQVPLISYASTSPDLSDRQRYEYFFRTVPPDSYQARAMVDILKHFNWKSVHGIYSKGNYGRKGFDEFKLRAGKAGICVVSYTEVNDKSDFVNVVTQMAAKQETRVVVLILSTGHLSMLLKATERIKAAKTAEEKKLYNFKWLASDYWGTRSKFIQDDKLENVAEGAITLTLKTKVVSEFESYFRKLNLTNNKRNPWFTDFWQETFNCSVSDQVLAGASKCTGHESLPRDYRFDDKVPYVIDAIKALANTLHNVMDCSLSNCPGVAVNKESVLKYLHNLTFVGEFGETSFDENGSTVRQYEIFEYSNGFTKLGTWQGKLNLTKGILQHHKTKSSCSENCISGQVRSPPSTCCYSCHDCSDSQYAKDQKQCKPCKNMEKPNLTRTGCISLPEQPIGSTWVILMTIISSFGVVLTFGVILVFLYYNDTAVVKASGRDLSYPLLIGIILCYSMLYILLSEPTPLTCGIVRFGIGFCFFVCYAALVTKTNRIERIFKFREKPAEAMRPVMIGPSSQILIMTVMILIEALFAIIGLFITSPATYFKVDDLKRYKLKLCVLPNYDMIVAFSCNILSIIVCTVFAFRTRKLPASFNEAKYIGFVMYTTCVIWIAFITIYFGLNFNYRIIAICMNIFLSATSILAGVFGPKVYIILFRKSKNTRSRSELSMAHVYSNHSFEGDISRSYAPDRPRGLTVITEVEWVPNDAASATPKQ